MDDTIFAVISMHEAARKLFNEGKGRSDRSLQEIAARVLAFTATWLGEHGIDDGVI